MTKQISNMQVSKKDGYVAVMVHPKIYPLDVIYSAAYTFIDRAYIIIDGHPTKEIIVKLKPKKKCDLERFGMEFNNELLNYAFYKSRSEKVYDIKTAIIQRALLTNHPALIDELLDEGKEDDYTADSKGIAEPWKGSKGKNARNKG